MQACADCGVLTGRPLARYCDSHRWRHRGKPRLYPLTPEREAYMRAHYQPHVRGISHRVAGVLGVPKWRVCRWASELGLTGTQTERRPWTPEEDSVLEAHLGQRHIGWIAKRLRRSLTSVTVRAKRLGLSRRAHDWLTAEQVALAFGVDRGTPLHWIAKGLLVAQRWGQDHANGRASAWRVEVEDIRRFVQAHPTAFSLAKVDQVWFLDLVFKGRIGDSRAA